MLWTNIQRFSSPTAGKSGDNIIYGKCSHLIVKKNRKMLKGIVGCSFCAATLAVLPIMLHGDVVIVPNVGLPIFTMGDCFLAYMMLKKPQFEEESRHQRLTR